MTELEGSESVLNVLGDSKVREILKTIHENPRSSSELAEELDISKATVHRRLTLLEEHNLAQEDLAVSPDGNHYTVYESNFIRGTIALHETGWDVMIFRKDEYPNKLVKIWEALKQR